MALIDCPECNKEVSDGAKSCPSCGFQLKKHLSKQKTSKNKNKPDKPKFLIPIIFGVLLLIIIIIGVIIGINLKNKSGYFENTKWGMDIDTVTQQYKQYKEVYSWKDNDGDEQYWCIHADNYSFYDLTGSATITFLFDKEGLHSLTIKMFNCSSEDIEKLKVTLGKYYNPDEYVDNLYYSPNSEIYLHIVVDDLYIYYSVLE